MHGIRWPSPLLLLLWMIGHMAQDSAALRWTQDFHNGSSLHHCVGDDVTFNWTYVTNDREQVKAMFLFSEKNGTLVTRFASYSMTSSDRVTYIPDAGMTISSVTSDDAGLYGVQLWLGSSVSPVHSQVVHLIVVEAPTVQDGAFHVQLKQRSDEASVQGPVSSSCQSGFVLQCGPFFSTGIPPVSVVWTDPDNRQLTSSGDENGYFLLHLPAIHKGGNYTCTLLLEADVLQCSASGRPFMTSASLFVETTETQLEKQAAELKQLREELLDHNPRSSVDVKGKLQALESAVDNVTELVETQRSFMQAIETSSLQSLEKLKVSLHTSMAEAERNTTQMLQTQAHNVSEELSSVLEALTVQQEMSAELGHRVNDLYGQLGSVTRRFEDQKSLNDRLQADLQTMQASLGQKDTVIADLQASLQSQQEKIEKQERVNSNQVDINAEQLAKISDQQESLRRLYVRLEHLEATSTQLQSALETQQNTSLETRKETSVVQETISKQVLPSLTALESGLQDQRNASSYLSSQLSQEVNERARRILEVNTKAEDVRQALDQASKTSSSELASLTDMMQTVQINISTAMFTLAGQHEHLVDVQQESSTLTARLSVLENRVDDLTSSVNTVQSRPLPQEVTWLQSNMSAIRTQVGSTSERVQTMASQIETIDGLLSPVRLVGGSNAREGRVELRVGRSWGTVCDDGWDSNDAKVVCAMLGYFGSDAVAKTSATFGQGSGPIVLDDVGCDGSEQDIRACNAREFGVHNCAHSEDAGVVCPG